MFPWVWREFGGGWIQPCGPLLSWLNCPCCFSACSKVSLAQEPSCAHAWGLSAQICPSSQRSALVLVPFR